MRGAALALLLALRAPAASEEPAGSRTNPPPGNCSGASAEGGRTVHWVQRSSDLLGGLIFFADVLGMRILRHEENEAACPITCNGAFDNPWSKTMVGTLTEDLAYALELTHNYGVETYQPGLHRAIVNFGVVVEDPQAAAAAAGQLGFFTAPLPPVSGAAGGWQQPELAATMLVIGPEDYYYALLPDAPEASGRRPRFHHVSIRVGNLQHSLEFYRTLLGMDTLRDEASLAAVAVGVATASLLAGRPKGYSDTVMATAVGYGEGAGIAERRWAEVDGVSDDMQIALVLIDDGEGGEVGKGGRAWAGRHAIAVSEAVIRRVATALEGERPGSGKGEPPQRHCIFQERHQYRCEQAASSTRCRSSRSSSASF